MNHVFWAVMLAALKIVYGVCIVVLSLYGFNSLGLAILYLLTSKKDSIEKNQIRSFPKHWPKVTIQLPLYNESSIIERLLQAVTGQDYPCASLQIQVLDDSTDETTDLARRLVEKYQARGFNICLIHRDDRSGYKAGALAEGVKVAEGDYLAVFDADFVPGPDWLRRMIPHFDSPEVGCVQSRWGHINYRYNLLTNAEGLGLDGHFIVEQNARSRNHLFMGFNGSGGIWRKACITDSGGWQSDTLTEDLDLSYRAQLRGWKIAYQPEIIVPGELPAQLDAFKNQQYRWAKGSAQTLRKLGGTILKARIPWYKRLMGIMHLSMYIPFPFMVVALLLTLPIALFAPTIMQYFGWTILASLGPPLLYSVSHTGQFPHVADRLLRLPALLLLGLGISLNSAFAVMSGIFTKGGVFNRTPKFNIRDQKDDWATNKYALPTNPVVWGELILGIYALLTVYALWNTGPGRAIAPGMIYYAISYLFVAMMSFSQSWKLHQNHPEIEA
jgi:cellulose synthase/poly-beta-1,6-N-acetylglucosamine synthase-like glycosyltransferase